jgi:hypothetical protein
MLRESHDVDHGCAPLLPNIPCSLTPARALGVEGPTVWIRPKLDGKNSPYCMTRIIRIAQHCFCVPRSRISLRGARETCCSLWMAARTRSVASRGIPTGLVLSWRVALFSSMRCRLRISAEPITWIAVTQASRWTRNCIMGSIPDAMRLCFRPTVVFASGDPLCLRVA